MSRYLGITVPIKGSNKTETHCTVCAVKLNKREYLEGSGYCQPCRKKQYNSGRNSNRNILGENRIDDILVSKMKGDDIK